MTCDALWAVYAKVLTALLSFQSSTSRAAHPPVGPLQLPGPQVRESRAVRICLDCVMPQHHLPLPEVECDPRIWDVCGGPGPVPSEVDDVDHGHVAAIARLSPSRDALKRRVVIDNLGDTNGTSAAARQIDICFPMHE
jgi:hypothetical protein